MERGQSSSAYKISTAPSSNAMSQVRADHDTADMHVVRTTKHLNGDDAQLFV
jgi:hypothetical protein